MKLLPRGTVDVPFKRMRGGRGGEGEEESLDNVELSNKKVQDPDRREIGTSPSLVACSARDEDRGGVGVRVALLIGR